MITKKTLTKLVEDFTKFLEDTLFEGLSTEAQKELLEELQSEIEGKLDAILEEEEDA